MEEVNGKPSWRDVLEQIALLRSEMCESFSKLDHKFEDYRVQAVTKAELMDAVTERNIRLDVLTRRVETVEKNFTRLLWAVAALGATTIVGLVTYLLQGHIVFGTN